jgi:hypothetical protein
MPSEIEGEWLNFASVGSTIARRLGMDITAWLAWFLATLHRAIGRDFRPPPAEVSREVTQVGRFIDVRQLFSYPDAPVQGVEAGQGQVGHRRRAPGQVGEETGIEGP